MGVYQTPSPNAASMAASRAKIQLNVYKEVPSETDLMQDRDARDNLTAKTTSDSKRSNSGQQTQDDGPSQPPNNEQEMEMMEVAPRKDTLIPTRSALRSVSTDHSDKELLDHNSYSRDQEFLVNRAKKSSGDISRAFSLERTTKSLHNNTSEQSDAESGGNAWFLPGEET